MNLKGRHLLKIMDLTPEEMTYLIDLAADLKAKKKAGEPVDMFRGKNIALIFEKTSTRTRCAFEVAGHDLGMGVTYLDPSARKRVLRIRRKFWGACSTESNTGASVRTSLKNWPNTPVFPCGTD